MPLVVVDIVELATIGFILVLVTFLAGFALRHMLAPPPARTIFNGKWIKRGKRAFDIHLNNDNVLDISVGRPRAWGLKVKKRQTLVPRGKTALVDKRAVLHGTGIPAYVSSERTGVASSPEFLQLCQEVLEGEVEIKPKFLEAEKPKACPICEEKNMKTIVETIYKEDGKNPKELSHWQCQTCKTVFKPVTVLNSHAMERIAEEVYDPALMQGIEEEGFREGEKSKPGWFMWGVVLFIPYLFAMIIAIMMTQA